MPKLEKYPSYKNSGVEWLGDIPEHWEVKRIKYITKLISGFPFNSQKFDEFNGVNVVRIGDIKDTVDLSKCIKSIENKIHKDAVIYKNDTLIALSGATTGKSCFIYDDIEEAFINQRIAKFNYKNSFLYYCVSNEKFKKDILLGADGSAQENISNTKIENMFIPFPDNIEQIKIASFLDKKTAQIDEAISQKQKLIELLKERKQIVINDAVTSGLDKNAEMIDSGIEWIGQIPKHWKIRRFKNYFKFDKGLTITKANLQDEGIFCVNYGEIHSKFGFEVNPKIDILKCVSEEYLKNNQNSLVKSGDFIFADTSEDIEGSGNFTYLNSDLITFAGYHTIICRPKNDLISRFLAYEFESITFRSQIQKRVKGVKVYSITQGLLKDLIIWLPPKEEQIKIVEYIDNQISKIDIAIELEQNYIEKLKEYKATLIDSVVTGKVKVC